MALLLLGQDIDEITGRVSLLGKDLMSLTLLGKVVWLRKAPGGSIKIGYKGVVEETGSAVGADLVHMNADGDFLFTAPADLYSATINVHAGGGGGGGGEGGETWGGSDGSGGKGGGAGSDNISNIVSITPHVAIPFTVGKGGSGGAHGCGSEDDGYIGKVGGESNWQGNYVTVGGFGGAGGTGHYRAGTRTDGLKGVDSSIGTGGAGGGQGLVGGLGGHAAGGGGGGGGRHDSTGTGECGGYGGAGGTGIIEIIW